MLDSARVVPDGALKAGYNFAYPDIDEALASLVLPERASRRPAA